MTFNKYIIGLGILSLCAVAQAAEVKITSFRLIGYRSSAAELCGQIDGEISGNVIIDVISDPEYKTPGQYSVIPSIEGKFCVVINTATGTASAKLRDQYAKVTAIIK